MSFIPCTPEKLTPLVLLCVLMFGILVNVRTEEPIAAYSTKEAERNAERLSKVWKLPEIQEAISLFESASTRWSEAGDLKRASYCLRRSAELNTWLANFDRALESSEKALKLSQQQGDHDEIATSLAKLAKVYRLRSDLDTNGSTIQKAIETAKTASDQTKLFVFREQGEAKILEGNLKAALERFESAKALVSGSIDQDLKASILWKYGTTLAGVGNLDEGLNNVKEALQIWTDEKNKRGVAIAHIGLGFIHVISNEKRKAQESYLKARDLFPRDVDLAQKALAVVGLAAVYESFGKFELAGSAYSEAKNLYKASNDSFGISNTISSQARVAFFTGRISESQRLALEARALSKKAGNKFIEADSENTLGRIDLLEGRYDEAIEKFKNSNAVFKRLGVPITVVVNELGQAYEKKKEYETAILHYQDALTKNKALKDSTNVAENYFNLARINLKIGNREKALKFAENSIEATESLYYDIDNNGLRRALISSTYERYELLVNILAAMHSERPDRGFDVRALKTKERARSRSMLETLRLTQANYVADANPELVKERDNTGRLLSVWKTRLANILSGNSSTDNLENIKNVIAGLEHKYEEQTARLKRESPVYSEIKNPTEFDLGNFQKNILGEDTVALEFSLGKEASYLWLIDNAGVELFTLPAAEKIESAISDLTTLIMVQNDSGAKDIQASQKRRFEADKAFRTRSQQFGEILFGQIADKLGNKRIIIIPDGKMHTFPFSSIHFPTNKNVQGKYQPLLLRHEIVYAPSASILQILTNTDFKQNNNTSKQMLIYSDPVFSANDPRLKQSSLSKNQTSDLKGANGGISPTYSAEFKRLPGTKNEARVISQTFGDQSVRMRYGFDANRQSVLNLNLSQYKVIHFATHGFFDESNPELSGIVLSRFQQNGNRRNGLIGLEDIYGITLAANLVVLSACDTVAGKELKGEGLMSLTNALLQVGAKSVVASRWKVDDHASAELIANFYKILKTRKTSPSKALREAQILMLNNPSYQTPYFWAAFAIHGEYDETIVISKRMDFGRYGISVLIGLFVWVVVSKFWFSRKG